MEPKQRYWALEGRGGRREQDIQSARRQEEGRGEEKVIIARGSTGEGSGVKSKRERNHWPHQIADLFKSSADSVGQMRYHMLMHIRTSPIQEEREAKLGDSSRYDVYLPICCSNLGRLSAGYARRPIAEMNAICIHAPCQKVRLTHSIVQADRRPYQ